MDDTMEWRTLSTRSLRRSHRRQVGALTEAQDDVDRLMLGQGRLDALHRLFEAVIGPPGVGIGRVPIGPLVPTNGQRVLRQDFSREVWLHEFHLLADHRVVLRALQVAAMKDKLGFVGAGSNEHRQLLLQHAWAACRAVQAKHFDSSPSDRRRPRPRGGRGRGGRSLCSSGSSSYSRGSCSRTCRSRRSFSAARRRGGIVGSSKTRGFSAGG
mmetsp:Transcript_57917/g.126931  ORF Transcript_57917/g.126931 Transcript_57917/m.126931 type:complete len:212 (-) Transcript_57917:9-644(-)